MRPTLLVSGSHPHHIHAPQREGDVGYDLVLNEMRAIPPLTTAWVKTGVRIKLPEGWWAAIDGRSSTLTRYGLLVVHSTIDTGFTGELSIGLYNVGGSRTCVQEGMRLAQLTLHQCHVLELEYVEKLPFTARGDKGFGSTGVGVHDLP